MNGKGYKAIAKLALAVILISGSALAENAAQLRQTALKATASTDQSSARAIDASNPKRLVLVSIAERKLALLEDGRLLKVYPVAVGATVSPSPTGQFKVVNRLVKPTYYHKGTVIAPGPKNPLGSRWIGLSRKGYGIHGTNAPRSIGKAASHGCIRMASTDLEDLFTKLNVGDDVEIRAEADSETAQLFATHTVGSPTPVADSGAHAGQ